MGYHDGDPFRAVICAAILIVAPLIPHHLRVRQRYWLHTGRMALMGLLADDLAQF
jgi:hypothetical protein